MSDDKKKKQKYVGYTSMDQGGPGGEAFGFTQEELDEAKRLNEEMFKELDEYEKEQTDKSNGKGKAIVRNNRIIGFTSAGNHPFGDEELPITEEDMKEADTWYMENVEDGLLPSPGNWKPAIPELLKETSNHIELVDLNGFQNGNDQENLAQYPSMDETEPFVEDFPKDVNHDNDINKQIHKSSRHSKITGDFAENIVLYWLSKYGYECARIDHVGVDLIARHSSEKLTMGISVKSRSREYDLAHRAPGLIKNKDILRLKETCRIFQWEPYVAFVVDSPNKMYIIMCSLPKYLSFGKTTIPLKSTDISKYKSDPDIKIVEFDHTTSHNW